MRVRVVGAGLGRTGTTSLKLALERLVGAPCYHMLEVFKHPEHRVVWQHAFEGQTTDWSSLFEGYAATVDWPGAGLWRPIHEAFPDAIVLLSTRPEEAWWRSASRTIFAGLAPRVGPANVGSDTFDPMSDAMMNAFTPDFADQHAAIEAYRAHNAAVRSSVAPSQLLEWSPGDGWEPLADALGVVVPDEPFPHLNTTDDFRAMAGLDD